MTLDRRHSLALIGATLTSAIALGDAVTHGLTGQSSVFASDSGATAWAVIGGLIHGLTYAALCWVLVGERDRFATANRFARALRRVLIFTFAVMAVAFVVAGPILTMTGGSAESPALATFEVFGTAVFLVMILASLLLGLALLRNHSGGVGARLLAAITPVLAITVLLGFIAPDWTHPGYVETLIHFGVALLGVGVADRPVGPAPSATPATTPEHLQ